MMKRCHNIAEEEGAQLIAKNIRNEAWKKKDPVLMSC